MTAKELAEAISDILEDFDVFDSMTSIDKISDLLDEVFELDGSEI